MCAFETEFGLKKMRVSLQTVLQYTLFVVCALGLYIFFIFLIVFGSLCYKTFPASMQTIF